MRLGASTMVLAGGLGLAHAFVQSPVLRVAPTVQMANRRPLLAINHAAGTALRSGKRRLTTMAAGGSSEDWDMECDVVVIGSGIGGLSCAALLASYGYDVRVCESHTIPGGCAHGFERDGFMFDSGPSLWNGMSTPPYNPLRDILDVIGEGDSVKYAKYDGWGMHVPEGSFKFLVGEKSFEPVLEKFGGPNAVQEWRTFMETLQPLTKISTAMTPLALRADLGAVVTVGRYLPSLLRAGFSPDVTGPISKIADKVVTDRFILNWLNFLAFAISGLPADATIAAAMAYTLRDLHQPTAALDYPVGGSAAIIDALVRGLNKHSKPSDTPRLMLNAHVDRIVVEGKRATGVVLRKGKRLRAKKAVVSNASVWDTLKLVPPGTLTAPPGLAETPATPSFVHLHLGIDATGLPKDLDCHHTVINHWDKIDDPQNMAIISIPTTLDPSMAPPGHHVVHVYAAANEPYEIWKGMTRNSPEYKQFKKERAEFLYQALERVIPDVRQRVKTELIASPLTHERFLRRAYGSYGPALKAGEASFPGPKTSIKGLLRCGDSTFPGIGVPAVAASGANAANTLAPVWKHWGMLNKRKRT